MTQQYTFKTHTTLFSSAPPRFSDGFIKLSGSDSTARWLAAGEDSMIDVTTDGRTVQSITVPSGAIVLCERTDGAGWSIEVPVARNAFDGERTDDLREPVSRGRRTGPKGTHV